MTRRKFGGEFNTEAVKLVTERGVSVARAARDLDLAESVLRRWMRELAAAPTTAFPGHGQQRADLAEIAALKKEVAKLKAERDILKKAAATFDLRIVRDTAASSAMSPRIVQFSFRLAVRAAQARANSRCNSSRHSDVTSNSAVPARVSMSA